MADTRWSRIRPGDRTGAGPDDRPPGDRVGADDGVAALFRTHRLGMVRLALLLVDDQETAEDVVQDAFAALHRRWASLFSPDAAVGYLRTSVVNGARSVLRRRRTVRSTAVPAADAFAAEPSDARLLLAEEHAEVLDALRRLPARQREVIVLRYWAELGEAEIAATLDISIGAVKSSASRGRDAIADLLGGQR